MKIDVDALRSIKGEHIGLRPITDADTDSIVGWRNKDAVRMNFIFREKFTQEMHRDWLKSYVYSGKVIQYIIEEQKSSRAIGSVYIRDIDLKNQSGEFGILIGEDEYRGKGYGTETARLFIPYCFSLGFHRIFLRVLADNRHAVRCYRRAGFREEGTFRDMVKLDGRYQDVVFMSVLENEWESIVTCR